MKDWPRVYIAEEPELEDFDVASARFSCHVEFEDDMGEQMDGLELAEALRWGRERASVVFLRLFDSGYFSAGEHNPEPDEVPPWPEDTVVTRRRPRGLEALDNTVDDPPVLWDLRLRAGEDVDEDVFRASVEADERTLAVPADAHDPSLEGVRVLVKTSTRDQAWAMAESIWTAARSAAPHRLLQGLGPFRAAGYEVYRYAPGHRFGGGSIRVTPAIVSTDDKAEPGDQAPGTASVEASLHHRPRRASCSDWLRLARYERKPALEERPVRSARHAHPVWRVRPAQRWRPNPSN